jgi:hypothetical protein
MDGTLIRNQTWLIMKDYQQFHLEQILTGNPGLPENNHDT